MEESIRIPKNYKMKTLKRLAILAFLGIFFSCSGALVSAQLKNAPAQITFDSFTGIYHLSRDSRGLSFLTTEETILADFPGNGSYYGITRSIPKKYQNSSVDVKILSVSDAAGNPVPYKTKTDSTGSLVITTGDPAINLYGSQTIKIKYQTSGVINLKQKTDEFLLNVNGRGWDQPFNKVEATLYVPKVFNAKLTSEPKCYLALNNSQINNCNTVTQKKSAETVITAKSVQLAPHQALLMKLNFAPTTFTNQHPFWNKTKITVGAMALMFATTFSSYLYLRKR
jgi:hypothetical protein